MYLAGLAVDPKLMTEDDLQRWLGAANWYLIAECAVGWVAAESPNALKLAREWII